MRKLILLKSGNAELCLVTWKDAYDTAVTKASWSCVLQYSGAHSHSYTRNVAGLPFSRVKNRSNEKMLAFLNLELWTVQENKQYGKTFVLELWLTILLMISIENLKWKQCPRNKQKPKLLLGASEGHRKKYDKLLFTFEASSRFCLQRLKIRKCIFAQIFILKKFWIICKNKCFQKVYEKLVRPYPSYLSHGFGSTTEQYTWLWDCVLSQNLHPTVLKRICHLRHMILEKTVLLLFF